MPIFRLWRNSVDIDILIIADTLFYVSASRLEKADTEMKYLFQHDSHPAPTSTFGSVTLSSPPLAFWPLWTGWL